MGAMNSVIDGYGSFFEGAVWFSISPYNETMRSIMADKGDIIPGLTVCTFLTFFVPVLPAFTAITFSLACIASSLASLSLFLVVPAALAVDIFSEPSASSYSYY